MEMSGKYDQYVVHPPHLKLTTKADKTVFFDGLMVKQDQLGCDFTFGHQFVTKPFRGDNPTHSHNFWEFMAWYGSNPEDPNDFQAEVVFYFGKELEKHIFTRPTIISLPPGLIHHPFEITRVDSPIIQIEIMIANKGVAVDPYFAKDKAWNPATMVDREYL
jgi:hypothetical protein